MVNHGEKSVPLLGDFNASSINWKDDPLIALNHHNEIILEICEFCGLTQLTMQNTRGNKFLDLVLTTSPEYSSHQLPYIHRLGVVTVTRLSML